MKNQPLFQIIFAAFFISFFAFIGVRTVFADDLNDIYEEKSEKQAELDAINKQISSIASSKSSISTKLSELKKEKKKLIALTEEMDEDVSTLEKEAIKQESELVDLASKYSLQQALYYVESQKSIFVTLFESPNITQVLDRMLYNSIQEKLILQQKKYIETKLEGISVTKDYIASERRSIQDSLSGLNKEIAKLEDEQSRLALSLSRSYAQSSALSSDIKKLSSEAKAILDKKSSGTKPPTGDVGTGTGGGGSTPPPPVPTPNPSGAISILINGDLLERTDNYVKLSSSNNDMKLVGASTGSFPGFLVFNNTSGTYAINSLPIDQYLWGLAEMPSSWPLGALKVQAIAGRSYAVYKMVNGGYGKFDIYDSVRDQNYVGLGKLKDTSGDQWKRAVDETSEEILKYNGNIVQAFYSAESGGHTLSSSESPSFGATRNYLSAQPDRYLDGDVWKPYGNSSVSFWLAQTEVNTTALMEDYLNGAIYYESNATVKGPGEQSASALEAYLGENSIQSTVGEIQSIDHIYNTEGTTILENTKFTKFVKVTGSLGELTLSGAAFKASYNIRSPGRNALWSTLYDIKKINDNKWEMWSRGWGHRVGMSQYGAYGRASAGQSHSDILSHYYNGANVVQYSVGRNIKVALEKYGSRVMTITSKGEISIYEGASVIKKVPAGTVVKIEYN